MTESVLLLTTAPYLNLCISLETSCYLMLFPSHLKAVYLIHVSPSAPGAPWGLYLQNITAEPLVGCRDMQGSQSKSKCFLVYDMFEVGENS